MSYVTTGAAMRYSGLGFDYFPADVVVPTVAAFGVGGSSSSSSSSAPQAARAMNAPRVSYYAPPASVSGPTASVVFAESKKIDVMNTPVLNAFLSYYHKARSTIAKTGPSLALLNLTATSLRGKLRGEKGATQVAAYNYFSKQIAAISQELKAIAAAAVKANAAAKAAADAKAKAAIAAKVKAAADAKAAAAAKTAAMAALLKGTSPIQPMNLIPVPKPKPAAAFDHLPEPVVEAPIPSIEDKKLLQVDEATMAPLPTTELALVMEEEKINWLLVGGVAAGLLVVLKVMKKR